MGKPVRIVVVDDSTYLRLVLRRFLDLESDFQVVGEARDGIEALDVIQRTNPDVVTLDVEMPRLNGLETLQRLMAEQPRPVIMVSSLTTRAAATTLRALDLGAVDFVSKPNGATNGGFEEMAGHLVDKIRVATIARVRGRPEPLRPVTRQSPPANGSTTTAPPAVVVIGSSTGGPQALCDVLSKLSLSPAAAYVIVQHLPAGFTQSLAARLDQVCALRVREAAADDRLTAGEILVAPGDRHLVLGLRSIALSQAPRLHGVRPSVDVTLKSAATAIGSHAVAVILTGMGTDGADGCEAVRSAHGYVIAQDAASCVVDGMPRAVRERGLADAVLPLDDIADGISRALSRR